MGRTFTDGALTPLMAITHYFRLKQNIYTILNYSIQVNVPITNYDPCIQCLKYPMVSPVTNILHFGTHVNIAETYLIPVRWFKFKLKPSYSMWRGKL